MYVCTSSYKANGIDLFFGDPSSTNLTRRQRIKFYSISYKELPIGNYNAALSEFVKPPYCLSAEFKFSDN